jgi:hypothetical protein
MKKIGLQLYGNVKETMGNLGKFYVIKSEIALSR